MNTPKAFIPETKKTENPLDQTPAKGRREFFTDAGKTAAGFGIAALLGNLGNYALSYAADKEPIKIGILHSLSGTMAISEVSLRDVVLMAVEEINAAGRRPRKDDRACDRRSRVKLGFVCGKSQATPPGSTKWPWCSVAGRP